MLKCSKNKLWFENPINLVCDTSIIPMDNMNYTEKMNAITRLIIFIFIIMLLLGLKDSIYFLLLSLIFIIILYYYQRNNMTTNNIEPFIQNTVPNYHNLPTPNYDRTGWEAPIEKIWCNSEVNLDSLSNSLAPELLAEHPYYTKKGQINNPEFVSDNQKLTGQKINPKAKIAPVIVQPAYNLDYWKTNNLVNFSQINEESNIDLYQSGYQVTTCCPPHLDNYTLPITKGNTKEQNQVIENLDKVNKINVIRENFSPQNDILENYEMPLKIDEIKIPTGGLKYNKGDIDFTYPYLKTKNGSTVVLPGGSGLVNAGCGYNPKQLFSSDLPGNLPAGNAQKDPRMKKYNKDLFTQTIQPGITTRNEVNEPINANIGISFTQQFEPLTCNSDPISGDVEYTEHDPRIIDTDIFTKQPPPVETDATEANVYDPRFTSYGTSYRSYSDDNIGQTRFYYDDINAIRMPNYLVRSNIDREPFADKYGPIPEGDERGNQDNPIIRGLANNAFLDGALEHRTDLQERLMRKANARNWQQRQAPIRTGGQRMGGGTHRIV
jgi:hypothetical protein